MFINNIDLILNIEGYRITNTQNNRSDAWISMLNIFYENALYGIGLNNLNFSENSYLRLLATSGITGFILFFIAFVPIIFKSIQNFKNKTVTIFSSLILTLSVTALSEGFLLDTFTLQIIVFLYSVSNLYNIKSEV